jgi:hypothetical protein
MLTATKRLLPLLACLALAMTGQAVADDAPHAKLKALLPPAPNAKACYVRTYDAKHLEQHPKQRATEMILFLRYTTLNEEEAHLVATDDGGLVKQYFDYDFTLAAKVRDGSDTLYASGDCTSAEAIGCGVDCDGGGVGVEPVAGGHNDTILVRLERIRMTLGCGDGEDVELEAGEDDKVFKLTKGPVETCDAMQAKLDKGLE